MNSQISVIACILHEGKILLQYNPKWLDYSFVGGKLEEQETPLQAAYREVEEELSITRGLDFNLEILEPGEIQIERFSKRTKQLTNYKFYLFFLIAKQNFLNKISTEKNLWVPVSEIQTKQAKNNLSELVYDVFSRVNLNNYDSFKNLK